jgi:hypothetical protein
MRERSKAMWSNIPSILRMSFSIYVYFETSHSVVHEAMDIITLFGRFQGARVRSVTM